MVRSFVVLNGLHPSAGSAGIEEARQMIANVYGLANCPAHLCQRSAYTEAMIFGASPQERDPDGKAGQKLRKLFQFVSERSTLRTVEQSTLRTVELTG